MEDAILPGDSTTAGVSARSGTPQHLPEPGSRNAVDAKTGSLVWNYKANESVYSSPAGFANRVFFGTNSDVLVCLDGSTGSIVWRAPFKADVVTAPAIAKDRIVVAGADGKVCTLK